MANKKSYKNLLDGGPEALSETSDEILLAAALEYPDLFSVLVDRYQSAFLRFAGRILNTKEEAEDVVQDSFMKIYRHADQLQEGPNSKFKSWAYKIVFNTALTRYRSLKKRSGEMTYLDTFLYETLGSKEFQDNLNAEIMVKEILAKMPGDFRELLEMHYLKGLSYDQISREKNITIPALKMRLFRAREVFRNVADGAN
ncbi:RNA polymerase sigma factor [Candidatus Giovannonibacteria bacterium]|nr:RNA polymerase sigma factor [Candidatus Giovannonibacteria bacterium]